MLTARIYGSLTPTQVARRGLFFLAGCASTPSLATFCESDDSLKDKLLRKDKDGNIQWAKSIEQVTKGPFWDEVAAMTGNKVQNAVDSGIPTQLSYGFICGYCSGMALKTVGRAAAVVFGLGFVTLQALAYNGYITVDHVKIKKSMEEYLDLNKDGKVNSKDTAIAAQKMMHILQYNLPAGTGFGAGFIGGIRSG